MRGPCKANPPRRCYGCKKLTEKGVWYKHSSGAANVWFCLDCSWKYTFSLFSGDLASIPYSKDYGGHSRRVPRKPTLEEYDTRPRRIDWDEFGKGELQKRREGEADAELEKKARKK